MNMRTVLWDIQGKGNLPLKHTYAEALPLIHNDDDVTEPNKLNYFLIYLLIYLFIYWFTYYSFTYYCCQQLTLYGVKW